MSEVEILLSLPKDIVPRENFAECISSHELPPTALNPCEFRYDPTRDSIFRTYHHKNIIYTYLAKADGYDIYKVGHTRNLSKRVVQLNHKKPYSLLKLTPIAFCNKDYESMLISLLRCKERELPEPFYKARELFLSTAEDVDFIIKTCGFELIDGNNYPGFINETCRVYYNPYDGHCEEITYSYELVKNL